MSTPLQAPNNAKFTLFALGFRPFFLAAGSAAVALMSLWLLILSGYIEPAIYLPATIWHSHEMIFGFVAAVITGFLLTAVQAWTGIPGFKGWGLALLFLLWLAARLLLFFPPADSFVLVALVDLAFFPITALILARYVLRSKQWRNGIFIPILLLFFIANLMVHLQALGFSSTANIGLNLGLWLTLLMIVILGGRVLPMFTSNGLGGVEVYSWKAINIGGIVLFLLLIVSDLLQFNNLVPWLAIACAGVHGVRLYGWRPHLTWRTPLLWVLHIGYIWLIIGLLSLAAVHLFSLPRSIAIHAFAVGTIGNFIMGMMSRVSLGHTGRNLIASSLMALAYLLVNIAALIRVILPMFTQLNWMSWILASGITWVIAYSLFLVIYIPILSRARIDAKPG